MRKQLTKSIENILKNDDNSILLLGDIGIFGFRNSFKNFPDRIYNVGILEQSMIGMAAGMSKTGLIPFVHTIAPFIVERALEQLKIDFGYQKLNGNFISVGASYDYSSLGATHQCPGDVQILSTIPNMQIVIPGNQSELDYFISNCYNNGFPTYYRLSENNNATINAIQFGQANILKKGNKATIICTGDLLDSVVETTQDLDVTILYYSTILPFDYKTLQENFNENIIVCEPFYKGTLNYFINNALCNKKYSIKNIGIEREFINKYGSKKELDEYLNLDVISIRKKILEYVNN